MLPQVQLVPQVQVSHVQFGLSQPEDCDCWAVSLLVMPRILRRGAPWVRARNRQWRYRSARSRSVETRTGVGIERYIGNGVPREGTR